MAARQLHWALLAAAVGLAPASARAHLGHVVQRAERYLKLDAHPGGVRLVVSLTLGPSEMGRVLAAADVDADREVSRAEADRYMEQWGQGLVHDLPVRVDGVLVPVRFGDAYFDPVGAVRSVAGTVEMVGQVPVPGGEHRVAVVDSMRVETFDRTDVSFEGRDGVALTGSGQGDCGGRERRLSYGRGEAGRELALCARWPEEPWSPSFAQLGGLGGVCALLIAGSLWAWRRRAARA